MNPRFEWLNFRSNEEAFNALLTEEWTYKDLVRRIGRELMGHEDIAAYSELMKLAEAYNERVLSRPATTERLKKWQVASKLEEAGKLLREATSLEATFERADFRKIEELSSAIVKVENASY